MKNNESPLSVFRNEKKYLISRQDAMFLCNKLDHILPRDEYSRQSGYIVRSLYFDSLNNVDYAMKLAGTEVRKKIRVRIYSADAKKCKLEIKQKNGDLQHKVSLWITRNDTTELMKGNYSALIPYFEQTEDAVYIYKTMVLGCYRPVVLVEYDRIAYTYPLYNTRVTIDMNIRSSEGDINLFREQSIYVPLMPENYVLEVKYNEKLVGLISELLRPYRLTQTSISKYCLGRKIFTDVMY